MFREIDDSKLYFTNDFKLLGDPTGECETEMVEYEYSLKSRSKWRIDDGYIVYDSDEVNDIKSALEELKKYLKNTIVKFNKILKDKKEKAYIKSTNAFTTIKGDKNTSGFIYVDTEGGKIMYAFLNTDEKFGCDSIFL